MSKRALNIAIVEDNDDARTNLRNYLLRLNYTNVDCFRQGNELKQQMQYKDYDVLLMDYYLGIHKNGVEVIQELQEKQLLKNVTSTIFVTSDHMPMVVGQIFDAHPDSLLLKPYNINHLEKTLRGTLRLNEFLYPVLALMDEEEFDDALIYLEKLSKQLPHPRYKPAFDRLKAKLLIKLERYQEACDLYMAVLKESSNVIWAKWGLILCCYLYGDIRHCEKILSSMLKNRFTRERACEWFAKIQINNRDYDQALDYVEQINESNMSLSATRLKAYLYQMQDRIHDAIAVLDKRRQTDTEIREHFAQLSLDMARCHLILAEEKAENARSESLLNAEQLIRAAVNKKLKSDSHTDTNYLSAMVAVLAQDIDKAKRLVSKRNMNKLDKEDLHTLGDAIKVLHGIGEEQKAAELLAVFKERASSLSQINEQALAELAFIRSEQSISKERLLAVRFNQQSLQQYVTGHYEQAIGGFYRAHRMFPQEPVFCLNLLKCMMEIPTLLYQDIYAKALFDQLKSLSKDQQTEERLQELAERLEMLDGLPLNS